MRLGTIAFLCGILAVQQLASLPDQTWCWLLPLLPLVLVFRSRTMCLLACGMAGFLWALWQAHLLLSVQLPDEYEGGELLLEGEVVSIPLQLERRVKFDFLASIEGRPYRLRLSWYEPDSVMPRSGEIWRLLVKLKRPHGTLNPGGFDYERHMFRQGIGATGYVRRTDSNQRLKTGHTYSLSRIRSHLSERIGESLVDHPQRGLIEALAIGHRGFITAGEWEVLARTGTSHLVAISGLHVGIVAGFAFFLSGWLARFICVSGRGVPLQVIAALAAIIVAIFYAGLAGFSIPTQRALIMVVIVMLSIILRRETRPSSVLSLALLGVLLYDAMAVLDAGFWLSFVAVVVIVFCMQGRVHTPARLSGWWRVQFVIAIGMLPVVILFFNQASIIAPVANLLAVPWVSFVTVPLTLIGTVSLECFPWLADYCLLLAAWSLDLLWRWLEWLSAFRFSLWVFNQPLAWTILPAFVGVAWLLMPRGIPARWMAIILLLPMFFVTRERPGEGEIDLTLLDVGQGQSVVVRTRNHTLVYDTGPRFSASFDTGRSVVVPFLRHSGASELDMLIVSHGDSDHSGGADSVLANYNGARVLTGANPRRWTYQGAEPCRAGQHWEWDGVLFEILHPHILDESVRGNNRSCVLQVRAGDASVLIPGDIERGVEVALVEQYGASLQSDILLAPHHGSRTSSSQDFLAMVQPRLVLVSNGYRNRYGFPAKSVTRRYEAFSSGWLETANEGAIHLKLPYLVEPEVASWRESALRYWHTR